MSDRGPNQDVMRLSEESQPDATYRDAGYLGTSAVDDEEVYDLGFIVDHHNDRWGAQTPEDVSDAVAHPQENLDKTECPVRREPALAGIAETEPRRPAVLAGDNAQVVATDPVAGERVFAEDAEALRP